MHNPTSYLKPVGATRHWGKGVNLELPAPNGENLVPGCDPLETREPGPPSAYSIGTS